MKGRSLIVVSGIFIVCIIIILATVQLKYSVFSESNKDIISPVVILPTVDTQTTSVPDPMYNETEKKIPVPTASSVVPNEWEKVIDKKYGFSYSSPPGNINEYFFITTVERPEDLKSYVQYIWEINKNDKNPNTQGKEISEIKSISINNNLGYQFSLTKSFSSDYEGSGYILDEPNLFTFFETQQGTKIITRGPLKSNNRGEQVYLLILNSFIIDSTLIPKNEEPMNWQTISRQSFSFKFPGNLLTLNTTINSKDRIYLSDSIEGMRGGVMVSVKDEKFDPTNIVGMYGVVNNSKRVEIGNKVWYSYVWGDGGAMSQIYLTDIMGNNTLQVSFGSMPEEEVYPISTDINLQKSILETFLEM